MALNELVNKYDRGVELLRINTYFCLRPEYMDLGQSGFFFRQSFLTKIFVIAVNVNLIATNLLQIYEMIQNHDDLVDFLNKCKYTRFCLKLAI